MMTRTLLLVLLMISITQKGGSQSLDKEKLDRYFRTLEVNDKFMGNALVHKNNKKTYSFSSGYSNLETKTISHKNTMYRIGSISKTFTATLVLKAAEEGKIDLSQHIDRFFPTIKNADKITVSQLLNHHSGIHNFTGNADYWEWYTQLKSEKEMIAIIAEGDSDFEPGSKAEYSNSNYVLLSYVLQHVYKKTYQAILNEKIIEPLHLKYTRFGDKATSQNNDAHSYRYEVGWHRVENTNLSIPMGAGGIVMSANDLAVFIEALFNGRIISETSLLKMKKQAEGYGMGLFEFPFHEKVSYGHTGKIDGFNSSFYYFPNEQIVYILLSNAENYDLNNINTAVVNCVFDKSFDIPKFNTYKVTQNDLLPYLGVYTSNNSPLIITISNKENTLLAQPKGQQIYTMEATDKNMFKHDKTGVTLEFVPSKKQMIMNQGEQTLVFEITNN